MRKRLVALTGAGISAESGLQTFRDSGGLWEKYPIEEVATIEAWERNPEKVLDFYNQRRRQLSEVEPNPAHQVLKKLEDFFDVTIITQNVDDLHERAGSSTILHLHGELLNARSNINPKEIIVLGKQDLAMGMRANDGSQLRPDIVWFGEEVPLMEKAINITKEADIFLVVGSSLQVYPAAGLTDNVKRNCVCYLIDKNEVTLRAPNFKIIREDASLGLQLFMDEILNKSE